MTTTKKFLKKNVFEEKEKRMFAVPKKKTREGSNKQNIRQ